MKANIFSSKTARKRFFLTHYLCIKKERFSGRIILLFLVTISLTSWSYNSAAQGSLDPIIDRANKFFELAQNYEAALPLYQQAVDEGVSDPIVHYRLGVCYAEAYMLNQQLKAIPYLEFARNNASASEVPAELYYYLGKTYHKDIQVQEAINSFDQYKKLAKPANKLVQQKLEDATRQLDMCKNALFLMNEKKGIVIHSFGETINSANTEYNPVVTADESMMAYTALREERGKLVEKIFVAEKSGNENWGTPKEIDLKTDFNVGTAGISADGREMIVFVGGANKTGSLYTIKKSDKGWSVPVTMGDNVNSRFLETTASITPNGKTIYFASNRNSGYGGMDIYKAELQSDGKWGRPENLGPSVNTPFDEDAPFIHPDSRTLFFTSNGPHSMGGYDIFKTNFVGGKWGEPENLGYPINTPTDDNYFTLTANGKMGYFSSERKGGKGGQDIYYFEMPEQDANIPLTLMKGRILAGEGEPKPVPTEIKVVDNEAHKKLDYVYNPEKNTGNYLIILPPGRNYDLIIESEGYLPYTVNINIPNQDYFYELYQEIILKPIKQFGVVVGQEISVKNAFHNVKEETKTTVRQANEAMLVQKDSLDLYDMMESIIAATDTAAFEYLLDLMYTTNPIDDVDFDKLDENKVEAAGVSYFYDETGTDNLEAKKVGNETIYTLPTFYVTEEAVKQKNKKPIVADYDKNLLNEVTKIFFDIGASKYNGSYTADLQKIADLLKKHEALGVEIAGYASPEGNAEDNQRLSNERAIEILNFFNQRGIVRRRIKAKGYGATVAQAGSKDESRRVEIRFVDLNTY